MGWHFDCESFDINYLELFYWTILGITSKMRWEMQIPWIPMEVVNCHAALEYVRLFERLFYQSTNNFKVIKKDI